ncbi:hypothetical protein SLEP1_g41709 [Rubroshorea leprosula]|uniref:Uncharacterized protein n=1 Tax=Rubroshorea leprosula TaxID=152421 RepID=A0AAV5L8A5_9ROSI|nr:hypothetical protein SLEP1_g41709 [Rubroshorea leprosula]
MDGSLLFDEIFLLSKLVSLNLSYNYDLLPDDIKFQMLVHNLTELRFLILDSVNMSLVLPSSLLNLTSSLEHLSLSFCSLQGNFPSQVFPLTKLVSLDLSVNYDLLLDNIKFQMLVHNLTELRFLILDSVNMSLVVPSSLLNLTSSLEHLSLSFCNLQGNFPNRSSTLEYLNLANTNFSGELPHSIGNLKLLKELNLHSCQFYGSIPRSLANLTEITQLDFSSNHMRGQIPDVFGKIHKLTDLSLDANNFGGEILASIFNLTHLTFLSLSSNKLLGRVASWLFSLPSLYYLDLQNNRLTRHIDHIEKPNLILEVVCLSNNEISGSIPSSFFDLVHLIVANLSSNNLTGTITPDMLSKFVDLEDLDLSNNSLLSLSNNGTAVNYSFLNLGYFIFSSCNIHKFPSFLRKAEKLYKLDISKNKISDLFGFGNLEIVDLGSNLLQGSLPILSTTWDSMQQLLISGNNLTGEIPSSYCNFTSLEVLVLANNRLGGKIPECLRNLSALNILDLRMNKFHGMRDIAPDDKVKLEYIDYYMGCLRDGSCRYIYKDSVKVVMKGLVVDLVRILKIFTTMDFSSNRFHGQILEELGELNSLLLLNLSHNSLNGQIPSSLGKLAKLESLDLSSNKLEGKIPEQLTKLTFLFVLNLSHNEGSPWKCDANCLFMEMLVSRDCPCQVPLTINQQSDHCLYLASHAWMHLGKEFLRFDATNRTTLSGFHLVVHFIW